MLFLINSCSYGSYIDYFPNHIDLHIGDRNYWCQEPRKQVDQRNSVKTNGLSQVKSN